jgi:hypothetical protein
MISDITRSLKHYKEKYRGLSITPNQSTRVTRRVLAEVDNLLDQVRENTSFYHMPVVLLEVACLRADNTWVTDHVTVPQWVNDLRSQEVFMKWFTEQSSLVLFFAQRGVVNMFVTKWAEDREEE